MRTKLLSLVVVLAVVVAGCGGSSKPTSGPDDSTDTTEHVAKVASNTPSKSAQMVCSDEAQADIKEVIGATPTKVSTPTWKDHVYSCDFNYGGGNVMTLSVKELSSDDETTEYYEGLQDTLGKTQDYTGLGDGAYGTPGGSLIVRKDYKVMTIDTSKLPPTFGVPPDPRSDVALNIAFTIMGCWVGE